LHGHLKGRSLVPDAGLLEHTEVRAQINTIVDWIDLIISDYDIHSGQSGITAIAKLRETCGGCRPLMSSDTAPERLREARESGHHLLHKPVQLMKLRAMVSQFVTKSQPA
jgi:DNA-binding response OmpR family regulator